MLNRIVYVSSPISDGGNFTPAMRDKHIVRAERVAGLLTRARIPAFVPAALARSHYKGYMSAEWDDYMAVDRQWVRAVGWLLFLADGAPEEGHEEQYTRGMREEHTAWLRGVVSSQDGPQPWYVGADPERSPVFQSFLRQYRRVHGTQA